MTSGIPVWARRGVMLGVIVVFAAIQGAVNGVSRFSDLRGAGSDVPGWTIAVDETSSFFAWLVCMVVIWWLVALLRPPRFGWPAIAALHLLATVPLSLLHIGLMVMLREGAYALGGVNYDFAHGRLLGEIVYEYRKDAPSYFLLAAAFAGIQWTTRPAPAEDRVPVLTIQDGTRRIRLPHAQIDRVEAAGNYVELHAGGAVHLHRATLAALESELGEGFVRIHRSRLLRRDAVREIRTLTSGDFIVKLEDGSETRGSRRYRSSLH